MKIANIVAWVAGTLILLTALNTTMAAVPDQLEGNLTIVDAIPDDNAPSVVQLGQDLKLNATGALAEALRAELAKPNGVVVLYLDGVRMVKVFARRLEDSENDITFAFQLTRNSADQANREAWDSLLKTQTAWKMDLGAAVGIGESPARLYGTSGKFTFYVAMGKHIGLCLGIGIVLLLLAFRLLVTKSRMLRDESSGFYSLGKSQMAFWGLLVVITFTALWILTGTMENIPPSTLILLGISASTGLGAVLVNRDVPGMKNSNLLALSKARSDYDDLILKIKSYAEKHLTEMKNAQLLLQAMKDKGATLTPEKELELKSLPNQINALNDAILQKSYKDKMGLDSTEWAQMKTLEGEILALELAIDASQPRGFWRDIVNDGKGASFHRAQVVVWTLVLGAVFVGGVLKNISMPEFSETLLLLMGISNSTYLGFKTLEK